MPTKNTILTIIPRLKPTQGRYAVEVEAEGDNLPGAVPLWNKHADASLKSGRETAEYVMNGPREIEGVYESLKNLDEQYKIHGSKILDSQTSGVHVHVNVQDYTPKEVFTFIVTYFVLEELLLKFCGPHREGNHFCLRAKDAEFIIHELGVSAHSRKLSNLNTDNLRYCSLNPVSLFKYGSIEFRAMRGTGNLAAIREWVDIINRVRLSAKEFGSPDEVVKLMSMGGVTNFIRSVLRDKADFFLAVPNYKELVKDGIRLIQPLAYAADWDLYKDERVNPFRKEV